MIKYSYNLKKILKDEIIPKIDVDFLNEELKNYGTIQHTKYKDGGFQLSLISDTEITDFEPIKQIILNHDYLNGIKAKQIQELNQNAQEYILKTYPYHKQLNIIRDAKKYKNGHKNEMVNFIDNVIDLVANKESEIKSKKKESTILAVKITF